ncbi:MAG: PKD domain-containing protein, partial [Ginsengibacter sp.]
GSKSSDPDGKISAWQWTKVSGPASFTIVSATAAITQVSNLTEGVYQFELKVTDAGGLFSKDTVQVTVSAAEALSNSCDSNRPLVKAKLIPIATLPEPRAGMVVASAGNKILFAGGTRVDIFDFVANTWSSAELSSKRRQISAVAAGNKIFFAGGIDEYDFFSTDVDIYDVATGTWSLSHMTTGGSELTTATIGNKVCFAGGNFGIYATTAVNIYDLNSNTWSTASLSAPRNFPTSASANNKVYFVGGDPWTGQLSNTIDIYDNTTGAWSSSHLQVPRVWGAALAVNGILYIAGGYTGVGQSSNYQPTCSVETLNTNTGARTLMNLSAPQEFLYAVVQDNKILFLDGADSDKFDIYDITSNTWSIGVLPYKISVASVISVNHTTYIAGTSINGVLSGKIWKLEF